MSADLFAQFGPLSGNKPQSSQPQATTTSDDPFAFLSSALPHSTSQQLQQPPPPQPTQPQPFGWSAFGSPSNAAATTSDSWGGSSWRNSAPAPAPAANADDGDDTWGDFEDASSAAPAAPAAPAIPAFPAALTSPAAMPPTSTSPFWQTPQAPPAPPQPRTRITRASTIDLMSNTLINFNDTAAKPPNTLPAFTSQPIQEAYIPETLSPPKPKKPADPNVLFDAEEFDGTETFDDDDEFGDFETGEPSPPPPPPPPAIPAAAKPVVPAARPAPKPAPSAAPPTALGDLLSLSDPEPQAPPSTQRKQPPRQPAPLSFGSTSTSLAAPSPYPQHPKSPSFQERNPFPGLALTTPKAPEFPKDQVANRTPSPVTVWPTFDKPSTKSKTTTGKGKPIDASMDEWAAWDLAESAVSPETSKAKGGATASGWDWDAVEEPAAAPEAAAVLPAAIVEAAAKADTPAIPDTAPPPTSVPPPSILLSLFPTLLALPDEALFKPTASQPAEVRTRILGDPKTISFLRNYLQLVVVVARVVAGRKQRWHRDKFLSQSMSISAAGSSKGGGMKLAGVDKAQGQREDREAADVVAVWRRLVGKLRTVVATANSQLAAVEAAEQKHQTPLKIPDFQNESIPVATAKMVPTAPRPCVVCGLRRDERVRGVDSDDVQDSFGEWWVEHWGHRACKNFWVQHESALRSR